MPLVTKIKQDSGKTIGILESGKSVVLVCPKAFAMSRKEYSSEQVKSFIEDNAKRDKTWYYHIGRKCTNTDSPEETIIPYTRFLSQGHL